MVKLYYTATSCGASNFIAAFVAGLSIDAETVSGIGELITHTYHKTKNISPLG